VKKRRIAQNVRKAKRPRLAPLKIRRLPVRDNLYSRAITFLYGTAEQINAAMKKECASPDCFSPLTIAHRGHWHLHEEDGYESDYICLVRGPTIMYELGYLAHEVLHHTVYALGRAGLPPATDRNDEAHCYYMQWVIRNCLESINRR
jgi:hypothetical protein